MPDMHHAWKAFEAADHFAQLVAPIYAEAGFVYEIWYGFSDRDEGCALDIVVRNFHRTSEKPRDEDWYDDWQRRIDAAYRRSGVSRYVRADAGAWGKEGDWSDSAFWPDAPWFGRDTYTPSVCAKLPASMRYQVRGTNLPIAERKNLVPPGTKSIGNVHFLAARLARGG